MAKIALQKLQSQEEIAKRNKSRDESREALNNAESKLRSNVEAVIDKIISRNGYFFAETTCAEDKYREAIIGDSDKGYKVGQLVNVGIKEHAVYGPQFNLNGIVE